MTHRQFVSRLIIVAFLVYHDTYHDMYHDMYHYMYHDVSSVYHGL